MDELVPDFLDERRGRSSAIITRRHSSRRESPGSNGDECDNSDYTRYWSFPELGQFPSGADGEQMHCFLGLRYQDTVQAIFERRNQRTLGLVRSSHALAAPLLMRYTAISMITSSSYEQWRRPASGGLLWCPEVHDAKDTEDLIRRLQTVSFRRWPW